ncbi:MAG: DUF3623 domain-containing protein [Myxococcaceae bacterium]|nr:DUF3623 domain-containing protein [Myxococcaceae bacterium]
MTLETAIAVLAVLFAWWASTGLVLALVWLGAEARRVAFAASTFAALVGFFGTLVTSQLETPSAVWLGFVSALLVWGWHELAFLLGIVTGPNRAPCPPDAARRGGAHLGRAQPRRAAHLRGPVGHAPVIEAQPVLRRAKPRRRVPARAPSFSSLGDAALWRWIIRSRAERSTALSTAAPPVRP